MGCLLSVPLAWAGCRPMVDPPLPALAVPFAPLPQYQFWWSLTAECAGIVRPFDQVRWYVVSGASSFRTESGEADGAYQQVNNRIILAEEVINTGTVVRHEILHALLQQPGAHPARYFQHRCAGIVNCDGRCVSAEESSPSAGAAAVVRPSDLLLDLALLPASGRFQQTGGWYVALVSVQNPRSTAVRVTLPPHGGGETATFGYADECWRVTQLRPTDTIELAPGETRYQAFDNRWCGAGTLRGRGSLGVDSTVARQLVVQP